MKDLRIFLVSFVFFLGTPVLLFMLFLVFSGFLPEVLVVDIFPFLLIIGVLYAIRFFFAVRQGKGPFLISLLALFVAVGGLVLFVLFQPIHITPPIPTRDARRVTDLRQVMLAVELYRSENDSYPSAAPGCQDTSVLEKPLSPWLSSIPRDRQEDEGHPPYQYGVSGDGSRFVLKTVFTDKTSPYLAEDVDGTVLGCDCDDPSYCMEK